MIHSRSHYKERTFPRAIMLIGAVALAVGCAAQADAAKRREVIIKIQAGSFQPYRVGIAPFVEVNSGQRPRGANLADVAAIVESDLELSYLFEPVTPDATFYRHLRKQPGDSLTASDWNTLGAGWVLTGELERDLTNVRIRYTLTDVGVGRRLFSRRLNGHDGSERQLAHVLSDEIYAELARAPGIFQSRLVYVNQNNREKELHVCDFDGAEDQQVTFTKSINISPRWAGRDLISYTSYRNKFPHVWVLDLTRQQSKLLSGAPGTNSSCNWTRDGKYYAITLTQDGNPEIYLFRKGKKKGERLTFNTGIDSSPSFSPDGRRIVFTSDRLGNPQLYMMDADGANVTRLTYNAGSWCDSPDWSPTLDLITFVARNERGVYDICTIRPDGTGFRRVTDSANNENPHFSPDGLHIVFSRSRREGRSDIYTMDFDGDNVRQVTHNGRSTNPSWSP